MIGGKGEGSATHTDGIEGEFVFDDGTEVFGVPSLADGSGPVVQGVGLFRVLLLTKSCDCLLLLMY